MRSCPSSLESDDRVLLWPLRLRRSAQSTERGTLRSVSPRLSPPKDQRDTVTALFRMALERFRTNPRLPKPSLGTVQGDISGAVVAGVSAV